VILHFCGRDDWAAAERSGEYVADTLATVGFVHCSTAEHVHVPANALAHGRTDLVLLHIEESRLPSPPVWEQGDPPDPGGMLFPHVYGPIPLGAVVRVTDYPPGADGSFEPPRD
jgi:uncharacterized protein (DUF952 family)